MAYLIFYFIIIFGSFLISCWFKPKKNLLFYTSLLFFVLSSFFFRLFVPLDAGSDYAYYLNSYNFIVDIKKPFQDVSVSLIYKLIYYFVGNHIHTLKVYYWFLFTQGILFFVWLIFSKIETFKKIMFFSVTYFLICFTLLRNAIGYELVFLFYYYLVYNKKQYLALLLIAISFHYSSLIVLMSTIKKSIIKKKASLFFMLVTFILLITFINLDVFSNKIYGYYNTSYDFNLNHFFWIVFISALFYHSVTSNKKDVYKTRLHLIFLLFLLLYLINPIPAFRFSLYFLCIYSSIRLTNNKLAHNLNYFSIVFIVLFALSFFKTHKFYLALL